MGKPFKCSIIIALTIIFVSACNKKDDSYVWKPLEVTATAYNSVPSQTSYEHPAITAWGDSLKPGMKIIAVSKDLIAKGLKHNTQVMIEGFDDVFLVKDKMNSKWRNRIDIYMGKDVEKAIAWGKKKVKIKFAIKKEVKKEQDNPSTK